MTERKSLERNHRASPTDFIHYKEKVLFSFPLQSVLQQNMTDMTVVVFDEVLVG